eukprot:758651-Hanusia_phi.AAC.3
MGSCHRLETMADVRFLRHLRDNNMQKTMLFKGKKMTKEEVLQESLARAKDKHDTLLARMHQLTKKSSSNKDRLQVKNARFQWIAECSRLLTLSSTHSKEAIRILRNVLQRETDSDDRHELEEMIRGMDAARTGVMQDKENFRQLLGGIKRMMETTLASKRTDKHVMEERKEQVDDEICSLKNFHQHKSDLLQQEEDELNRKVQEAAKIVAGQEAEARIAQENHQNEKLDALRELKYHGSEKLMFELFQKICQIDQDYVDKLKANNEDEKKTSTLCLASVKTYNNRTWQNIV